jgi:multicomponent Na+:H+ antiporter subunit D
VPLPVALPFVMAALLAAVARIVPLRLADLLAMTTALFTGVVAIVLLLATRDSALVYWFGGWQPRDGAAIGISFTVDPTGAGLAALSSLLVLAAFVFSLHYFDKAGALYHVLLLAFLGAMCGFSLTGDLFNLFVFLEVMGAAAFALCGYKSEEPGPIQGALNFGITNTIGAFLTLSGLALLYGRTGALNMAQIGRTLAGQQTVDGLVIAAFVFIMAGFLIKAAVVPFHFWLADAHAVAPSPVCILFSGVMVPLGLYAAVRVYWTVFAGLLAPHADVLRVALVGLGVVTALLGAIMCFAQHHLKRLLAFSTISHIGLLFIAFALLEAGGLAGALIYTLGHAMAKAPLFLGAGILLHRFGSVDELELRGRGRRLPLAAAIFLVGAAGLASLPPFGTFLGEARIDEAAEAVGYPWLSLVFFAVGALTAAAVLRATGRVFMGWGGGREEETPEDPPRREEPETRGGHQHTPVTMILPALALLGIGLLMPFLPAVERIADQAAAQLYDWAGTVAHVLDGTPTAPSPILQHESLLPGALRGGAAFITAILLAGVALFAPRVRAARPALPGLGAAIHRLRRLHSGHIGDYVTWLTVGVVTLGVIFALILR